ncbi:YqgE/AlgH family protein [Neptunomonas sp. XY-337]|uniref:YqgE/AlgH family protein n=1 Tax=Neptunomonas sp. XY-337 TaxID=2561897 RepID=UPI0010AAA6A3|nr:YqgE/AlgH family protein [Neptunomonas sp. XY-337]
MSRSQTSLRDQFLISMPHLDDDAFAQSIIYICDHSEYGAMGLVINRPMQMHLDAMLSHLDLPENPQAAEIPVYAGGPVQSDRGFVLHREFLGNPWLATHAITDNLFLTTSMDILEAIGQTGQADALIALGYAGWGPGQLEQEISDNVWLSCPANSDIMFTLPAEERMQAAAAGMGFNLNQLTAQSGRA